MKSRNSIKITCLSFLTFVLTFVLAFVLIFPAPSIALSQGKSKAVKARCSMERLDSLERFVKENNRTAKGYTALATEYLECNEYTLSKQKYDTAIRLAKSNSQPITKLAAKYGLEAAKFFAGETTENEKNTAINTIIKDMKKERVSANRPRPDQCFCVDTLLTNLPGYEEGNICIPVCP